MKHLFLNELYFGFFQTLEDWVVKGLEKNRSITRLELMSQF